MVLQTTKLASVGRRLARSFRIDSRLVHSIRRPWTENILRMAKIRVGVLPDMNRDLFREKVGSLNYCPYTDYQRIRFQLGEVFKELIPADICLGLREMVSHSASDVFLLKNCPTDPNPGPTPELDKRSDTKSFVEEFFALGLMQVMMTKPFHDQYEKQGEVISQILAIKDREADFGWHTEHIHLRSNQGINFLNLFCIKGDPNGKTKFLHIEKCLQGLPGWVREGLQKDIFEMQTDPSFCSTKIRRVGPVLESDGNGEFSIHYNHDYTNRLIPLNGEARDVLEYFAKHLENIEPDQVSLERGDCLIINNNKVLHRRGAYEASTTWEDRRWLQRLYMQVDYPLILSEVFRKVPTTLSHKFR